jgi:hypothetical protein
MKTVSKVILAVCVGVLLTGCNEKEDALRANPEVANIGTFDGCEVSFVNRGYNELNFYMAKCPGNSTTTTRNFRVQSGKSTVFKRSTAIVQEIDALMSEKIELEAREAALAKLSPAERTALGIK